MELYKNIANELTALASHDLAVREKLFNEGKLMGGYNPEMEQVHRSNAERLRGIINEIGWPAKSKVGEKASEAAWLIVQHSIGEPGFMKACYRLLLESEADVNPQHIAYLCDRICYFEGKPQKYGTQFSGEHNLYPVEDKDVLNKLRKALHLKPLPSEIIIQVKDVDCKDDLHSDDLEFNQWRKKVGWI